MYHHRLRPIRSLAVAAALCAGAFTTLAGPPPAHAQSLGAEVDLGIPVGDTADALDLGYGFRGRVGFGLPVPTITFDLEAAFDYYSFPITNINDTAGIWRAVGGLRLGIGVPMVPEIFGHIGYGKLDSSTFSQDGLTWDLGLSSDLVSLPLVSFGLHVAYIKLVPDDTTTFLGLGIHAEFGL